MAIVLSYDAWLRLEASASSTGHYSPLSLRDATLSPLLSSDPPRRNGVDCHARAYESEVVGSRTSSTELTRALRNQAQQKRLAIKRAEITASRLRLVVQGLHMLLADEHFVTLLRAENVHTMPPRLRA